MGLFRFGLIAPLTTGTYTERSMAEYARNISETPVKHPDGTERCVPAKTLLRWYRDYKREGMAGLIPKAREDSGTFRTLSDSVKERIRAIRAEFPRINCVVMREKLIEEDTLSPQVGVRTIQRYVRTLKDTQPLPGEVKDRKAYEAPYPGAFWLADTKYYPRMVDEFGRERRCYMIAIIDDFSRMVMGAELFYADNAVNYLKVLKDAIATYGIPLKCGMDHGSPYDNKQVKMICAELGIEVYLCPVRDGASKGKIERLHRTLQERLIHATDVSRIHSLEDYNKLVREEVHRYSRAIHSTTGEAPFNRFINNAEHLRRPKSEEWLDSCFELRIKRKVRNDSTVSIDNVCYDVPPQFAGKTVDLRYKPDRPRDYSLRFNGRRYAVHPTDRQANFRAPREQFIDINYGMEVSDEEESFDK